MKKITYTAILCVLLSTTALAQDLTIDTSGLNPKALTAWQQAQTAQNTGEKIAQLSANFLGTPYQGGMMIGSIHEPEQLVSDMSGLDCFTYLDYVETLRRVKNASDFTQKLIETRYIDGQIDFLNRKHFFTDWANRNTVLADDITTTISPAAQTVTKQLNQKKDGGTYLEGLPVVERAIHYIPSAAVDETVLANMQTGDLIGIYTDIDGLDVTHTGFFINTENGPMLRHASSKEAHPLVLDEPFLDYIAEKPGIVVLRLRN